MEKHNVHAVHPLGHLGDFLGVTIVEIPSSTNTLSASHSTRPSSSPVHCTSSLTQSKRSSARLFPWPVLQNDRQIFPTTTHLPANNRRVTGSAHYYHYHLHPRSCSSAIAHRRPAHCWTTTHWTTGARPVIIRNTTHPAPGIHKRRQPGTNGIGEHCGQYGLPQSQRR